MGKLINTTYTEGTTPTYVAPPPFTESEVSRMLIAQQINSLTVDDNTALRMTEFYPEWADGQAYQSGYKVQRGGKLWRVV